MNYFQSSYEELRKVAWPTRNRAMRLTFLVLGFMIAVAFIIGVLDYVFGFGHSAILDLAPERALPASVQEVETRTDDGTPEGTTEVGDVMVTTSEGDEVSVEVLSPEGAAEEAVTEEAPATEEPSSEDTPTEETPAS